MARTPQRNHAPRRSFAATTRLPHPAWRLDPPTPDVRPASLQPGEFWERLGL